MRYSTYLGADSSTARDDVYGMTMEPSGLIVATGRTQSAGFPMTKGGPTIFNSAPYLKEGVSNDEPYIVKINPSLNGAASLVYSTFLGGGSASGQWGSFCSSVAVDARGAVYVGGETGPNTPGAPYDSSNLTAPQTFPYTPNAFLQAPQGSTDAMLMQINPSGDYLDYSTYLGGTLNDRTYGLAVDPDGNVVLTGLTFSNNFPLQNPAQTWPGNDTNQNAFVTEFSPLYTPSNLIIDNGATYTVTGNIIYDNEYIGQNSTGTLIQGGFTNTVNNNLELGQNAGASGSYTLSDSGSGSLLSVAGNEYIGYSGTGTFTQSGGTNTVTGILILGANAGSSGTYSLSGGSLTVGDYEAVGYCGTGSFTQSGGTHTVTALYLGTDAGASGSYTLSDSGSGSLLSVAGNEYVGYSGTGTFTQTGGSNTVGNNLCVGTQGGTGSYSLSGGSLSTIDSYIGYSGTGAFTQTGGTHTVTNNLSLGDQAGSSGTYNLSGGSLNTFYSTIGSSGTGTFNQSGGSHDIGVNLNGSLSLGLNPGSSGTYNLSGGELGTIMSSIGTSGTGTFNQSGGDHGVFTNLVLGQDAVSIGSYNLSGGNLLELNDAIIGYAGSGAFTQAGGDHTVFVDLILGNSSGASGTYNLGGGSLSIGGTIALGNAYIGYSGNGAFTQSGGTNTVSDGLYLGYNSGASGTYTLSGTGTLSATNEQIGVSGSGAFTQTGGTDTVTGTLFVGNAAGKGTFALLGGSATAGTYTQGANGTFMPGIASAVNFAKLLVTTTASLNGTVGPVLLGGYIPANNQLFHGVITAGGVTGAFSTVANSTPIVSWQPIYTATTFDLVSKLNYASTGLYLTHNQANVGNMLNGLQATATGDLANVLNTIAALPSNAAVANAYQQISPDKAAALSTMAFAAAELQKRSLSRRITDLRFGPEDAVAGGLGFNHGFSAGTLLAYNSDNLSNLFTGAGPSGAAENRWGVYLDPALIIGSQATAANQPSQTGFNYTIAGFNAGIDYRLRDDLLVGLASGYSHTTSTYHSSGGGVEANTWPLTAYGAYLPKPFYAYGSLGYTLNLFDLDRGITFAGLNRTAKSSPTGNQLNAYGETGYDLRVQRLVLTPAVSLAYSSLWVNSFTESNAGALDLNVSPQNAQSLQTGVGGKIALPIKRDSTTVVPQIYAFYQHEYSNSIGTLDARLSQVGSTFAFQSVPPHRNFAVVGANFTLASKNNLKIQMDYNAEVGRGNSTAHYLSAAVRWEF